MKREHLEDYVMTIPDFPEPGIMFRDITSLIQDPDGLRDSVDGLIRSISGVDCDVVLGLESRGFIFGTAIAYELRKGFIPVRKKGKLPRETVSVKYDLEYGEAELEIHKDAIRPGEKVPVDGLVISGERVVIVDDLIATGGTLEAACKLVEKLGGTVEKISVVMELAGLKGRERLKKYELESLIRYEGK